MLKSVHAQSGGWAGEDTNVCTHDYTDVSTYIICSSGDYDQYGNFWNKLKGYVHTSAPAQYEKYRNIGVWRCDGDAHLLVHAQSEKLECTNQLERWGQCSLRYPPTAKQKRVELKPWHQVQGGVVDPDGQMWTRS